MAVQEPKIMERNKVFKVDRLSAMITIWRKKTQEDG